MKIAVVVPSLGRPHLLGPLALNVRRATKGPHSILFVLDADDAESRRRAAQLGSAGVLALRDGGTYPQKVNAGFRATEEPFVAVVNDDVVFHEGWDRAARDAFRRGAGVVGPSDLSPATENGDNATMPIVRRSYIEEMGGAWGEQGTVLHEGYHHNFSETELWQLADVRGLAEFVPECVIEHRHPDWGKAEVDSTYRVGAYARFEEDQALFERRAAEWRR